MTLLHKGIQRISQLLKISSILGEPSYDKTLGLDKESNADMIRRLGVFIYVAEGSSGFNVVEVLDVHNDIVIHRLAGDKSIVTETPIKDFLELYSPLSTETPKLGSEV